MRDMIDFVLMQADGAHESDMNLIRRGDSANEVSSRLLRGLRDGKDWRDVVARVAEICGEKRVVHVELTYGCTVRPGGPFRAVSLFGRHAEDGCAVHSGMPERHRARGNDGVPVDG